MEEAAPELTPLARDAVNARWLSTAECEALTSVLLQVLLDSLDDRDEPSRAVGHAAGGEHRDGADQG